MEEFEMRKRLSLFIFVMMIGLVLAACSGGGKDKLIVGTQTYSETKTLVYMYKKLIEANTDIEVEVKTNIDTYKLVLEAMMADELEIMTTYTGTALASFFTIDNPRDSDATMEQTKRDFKEEYNITVFDRLGFANTYALAVT